MRLLARLLLLAAFSLSFAARAQDYPSKPIRLIIPFQPGGGSDTLARLLGEKLTAKWKQPVIVENHAGAGGNLGAEIVAKAPPDGYTLLISSPGPVVINKNLYDKLSFDPEGFEPVSIIATNYGVLAVNPKAGFDSVPQLIAYARANPNKLNYASAGSGTTPHLAGELFKSLAGINLTHVPYKGAGPAFTGLLGGEVDMMFVDVFIALPHVRTGRLRALALGGGARNPLLPNVPVMAETVPGFDYQVWQGMVAPAGTPAALRGRIAAAVAEAVQQSDMRKRLADVGLEAVGSMPAEMAQVMRADRERWGRVIRATGAKAD
ncbi:MAG TPA: tripartite tricarboxylate transporter substrate binding protein [Burkholderiales bacterium]|jgi:tripartite-type tricarboxylate transporter receptor subunit TctC|nr:tripartite tricarboxylate transporter substrate binding protein [Burkholderiales bacterium]